LQRWIHAVEQSGLLKSNLRQSILISLPCGSENRTAVKALILLVALVVAGGSAICAQESSPSVSPTPDVSEIPKGYEIGENEPSHRPVIGLNKGDEREKMISPDGRFAVLCPLQGTQDASDHYPPNLLVRLKPYAVIATVEKDGLPQHVTTELGATWNGNSMVAIWKYRRWGIIDLSVYEIENDRLKRVEPVMHEAIKYFERDIRARLLKRYPKESEIIIFLSCDDKPTRGPDFKFDGHRLLLALAADNKPNLAPGPHWTAELHAIWNIDTAKFDKVDFRPGKIDTNPQP
jgi:hypothetical protein